MCGTVSPVCKCSRCTVAKRIITEKATILHRFSDYRYGNQLSFIAAIQKSRSPQGRKNEHPTSLMFGFPDIRMFGFSKKHTCRCSTFRTSEFPEIRISENPVFWKSGNLDFRICPESRKCRFSETRTSGFPIIRISGDPKMSILGNQDLMIPGNRASENLQIRISGFPKIPKSGLSNIRIFGKPIIRISGFPKVRTSGKSESPDSWVIGNPNIQTSGDPELWIVVKCEFADIRTAGYPSIRITDTESMPPVIIFICIYRCQFIRFISMMSFCPMVTECTAMCIRCPAGTNCSMQS